MSRLPHDGHTHPYQVHRDASGPEKFARAAFDKGLPGISFTEHAPLWRPMSRHFMTENELERYLDDATTARERWAGRLMIRIGIEADWHPRNADYLASLLANHPQIEFASGSIHLHGPHWEDETLGLDDDALTALALRETLAAVRTGLFARINHIDFFRFKHPGFDYRPERHEDAFREIFEEMASRGIALEWNPSGLLKSYAAPHPCDLVWKWSLDYPLRREYGSDAHKAEFVGSFLDRLPPGLFREA